MKEIVNRTSNVREYFNSKAQLLKHLLDNCSSIYYEYRGEIFLLEFTEVGGFCMTKSSHRHDCTKCLFDFNNIEYDLCFIYRDKNWWISIPRNVDLSTKGFLVSVGMSTNPPIYINKIEENSNGEILLYSSMTGKSYFVEDCFPCDLRSLEKFCLNIK